MLRNEPSDWIGKCWMLLHPLVNSGSEQPQAWLRASFLCSVTAFHALNSSFKDCLFDKQR
jgi:hypothetical protein